MQVNVVLSCIKDQRWFDYTEKNIKYLLQKFGIQIKSYFIQLYWVEYYFLVFSPLWMIS